jgi:hypothetical protein
MRDDPDFGRRISKKVQEVKQDKQNILHAADEYGKRYEEEIIEGTKQRQLLLENGARRGLSEAQVMSEYGRFVPTVYTPILNFLYFMLRETEKEDSAKYRRRDAINEALIRAGQLSHDDVEADLSSAELEALIDEKLKELKEEQLIDERRQKLNKKFMEEEGDDAQLKDTPDMVEFLYGNLSLDDFNRVKKLKALAQSPNDEEAFLAFKKCRELCKQFNLDYDRIPCYVQKRK